MLPVPNLVKDGDLLSALSMNEEKFIDRAFILALSFSNTFWLCCWRRAVSDRE